MPNRMKSAFFLSVAMLVPSLALGQAVVGFGYNTAHECDPPAGLAAKAIAAGDFFSVAVKTDGTIAQWGYSGNHQLDNFPTGQNGFTAVAAGFSHAIGLKANGTVVQWGNT